MKRYFNPLPTKLPLKSQTRGKLLCELKELPQQCFPTIEWTLAQQQRIEAIKCLLDADPGPWAAWQEAKSAYYSYLTLYPPAERTAAQQAEINRLKQVMNDREYAARCLFYGNFG